MEARYKAEKGVVQRYMPGASGLCKGLPFSSSHLAMVAHSGKLRWNLTMGPSYCATSHVGRSGSGGLTLARLEPAERCIEAVFRSPSREGLT